MDQRIQSTLQYIQRHPNESFSISGLAKRVQLSYWHFSRLFRLETGTPPSRYVKSVKLRLVKALLEQTFLSVKEIAHLAGMDESHLVRDYQHTYGLSPNRYRSTIWQRSAEGPKPE